MAVTWETKHPQPLGARIPEVKPYAAKWPLLSVHVDALAGKPVPCVLGIEWYSNFDRPVLIKGKWWIGLSDELGPIRGGHCVSTRPPSMTDLVSWWDRYNQGQEGACVGFGTCRAMSLLNRAFYDAPWTYHQAQLRDDEPGEDYDGTSVDAGMQVAKVLGLKTPAWSAPRLSQGIKEYRWTSDIDEMISVMGAESYRKVGGIPFVNSWGRSGYPHITYCPLDVMAMLIKRGDCAVVVDR